MNSKYADIVSFIRSKYPGKDQIPLHEPVFAGNEKKYLLDCIDTTFVSSVGKYVDKFEDIVSDYTGAEYTVATVNGTAALHLAMKIAGVNPGDLVLTQPLTFIATCNAVTYCGAEPVFIDIDSKTLGMSADKLKHWLKANTELTENNDSKIPVRCIEKSTQRPISACVPMHTFGHPCEIEKIVAICKAHNIPVIEDAAESIGSLYKNLHTGTLGLMGIHSFNGNKTITTGGGGMILTNDEKLAKLAKHLTTQARISHSWKIEHDQIGYNYRMPNLNAALGCAQMERVDDYLKNKRELATAYAAFFANKDITFVVEPPDCRSNYWLNAIFLDNETEREEFLRFSNEKGVLARPCWTLMHKLPMYISCLKGDLSAAEKVETRLINIPSGAVL